MGIPADVTARGRAALAMFRDDRARVERQNPDTLEDEEVYTGLHCHLSQSSQTLQTGEDTAAVAAAVYTLFAEPETELQQGDLITVAHRGQTIVGKAGPPFRGTFSVSAKLESVAVS